MLVSVVVPVYNVEKHIGECIESLINQTYNNIEIILVDDGSTDESGIICDNYARVDNRVKVIHQKNSGLPAARNAGLSVTAGQWVLFVDSDDWIVLNAIEILISYTVEDVDFISFRFTKSFMREIDEICNDKFEVYNLSQDEINEIAKDIMDPMIERTTCLKDERTSACSKMYNTDFLMRNHLVFYESVKIHEDIPYSINVFLNAKNVLCINANLYRYRVNENSITNSYRKDYEVELEALYKCLYEKFVEKENDIITLDMYYNRIAAMSILIAMRKYCHKRCEMKFDERKEKYINLLSNSPYKEMLMKVDVQQYAFKKKMLFMIVKRKAFWVLDALLKRI